MSTFRSQNLRYFQIRSSVSEKKARSMPALKDSGGLEHKREELHQRLADALELPLNAILTSMPCSGIASLAGRYLSSLKDSALWPLGQNLRERSLSSILERIQTFKDPQFGSCVNDRCRLCSMARSTKFKNNLDKESEEVLSVRTKLCLDCLKSAGQTLKEGKCRIKHT